MELRRLAADMNTNDVPSPVRILVAVTASLGVAALAIRLPDIPTWERGDVFAVLLLAAGTLIAERFSIPLRHGTEIVNFALSDAVWAAGLLLVRPSVLTVAVLLGVTLGQVSQRRAPYKIAFNVGQFLVGITVAEALFGVLGGGSITDSWTWTLAFVAMGGCFVVNASSIVLVVSLMEHKRFIDVLVPPLHINVLHWAGNMVLGILAAVAWSTSAAAIVLLAAPIALSFAAYRVRVASVKERNDWRRMYEAGTYLSGPLGKRPDFQPFARLLEDILQAEAVELIVVEDEQVTVHGSRHKHTFRVIEGDPSSVDTLVSVRVGSTPTPQIALIGDEEQMHGVIAVYREAPLDERDSALLDNLAGQIALRLRNHRLFGETLEQARLAQIIGHTADGIFTVAPDGTVASWNPAMELITGCHRDRAIGRLCEEVLGPRMAETIASLPIAPTGDAKASDSLVERPDGSLRWLRVRAQSIRDHEHAARSIVVVAHDVTAEVQAEQLKHDFVSLVSHELRTPLTPLKGFLRSLLDGIVEDAPEARQEYYQIMLRQTERLERLIGDLLDVSQIESGNLLIEPKQIELGYLVRRQVGDFERQHSDRVRFHGPGAPLLVYADAMRVEQVLSNLISNALKYSPRETAIEVSVGSADGKAVVAVQDRGPGITEAEQERIFERFYRSDKATAGRTNGVGLGLFIARNLIDAMSGELAVSSELGDGSTFAFTLPLSYATSKSGRAASERSARVKAATA